MLTVVVADRVRRREARVAAKKRIDVERLMVRCYDVWSQLLARGALYEAFAARSMNDRPGA